MEEKISSAFRDLNKPSAYAGLSAVQRETGAKIGDVRRVLSKDYAYSLHKARRFVYPRLRSTPTGFWYDIHADLADMSRLKEANDGHSFLLVCVDVLSRQVIAVPLKTKHADCVLAGFEEVIRKAPATINSVFTDLGAEFRNRKLVAFFKSQGIAQHRGYNDDQKAYLAERKIQEIRNRLFKYFDANSTKRWLDVIGKICDGINNSYNRVLRRTPASINEKNWWTVWRQNYAPKDNPKRRTYFRVGDWVRIVLKKEVFHKSSLVGWTDEIFRIAVANPTNPVTFGLEDGAGEKIEGKFYPADLSLTSTETSFRIEKVLRRRVKNGIKEQLVRWTGHKAAHDSWIPAE